MFNIFEKKKFPFFLMGSFAPYQKASWVWEFFLGLVDPSRNRLISTAYQKKPGFSILACIGSYATSK